MGKTIRKSLGFILHVELGGINIMRRYIGILIIIILMSLTGCEAEELPKRLFLEKTMRKNMKEFLSPIHSL